MPFEVSVNWSPVHEMVISLRAFTDRRLLRHLEIGQQWYRQTAEQVGSDVSKIPNLWARGSKVTLSIYGLLRECPPSMTPEEFLLRLRNYSGHDIERYRAPGRTSSLNTVKELLRQRDDLAAALEVWNRRYFSSVDRRLMNSLEMESQARSIQVARQDPQDAVEDATNGIYLGVDLGMDRVVLAPQYHCRPYNVYGLLGNTAFYMYPVEPPSDMDSDPPARLQRLVTAFSDPGRLRILRFLKGQARSFTDILEFIGLAKSTVHYHMVVMRAAGIVRVIETRNGSLYALRPGYYAGISAQVRHYVEDAEH